MEAYGSASAASAKFRQGGHVFGGIGFLAMFPVGYQQFPPFITAQTTQTVALTMSIVLPPPLPPFLPETPRGPDHHLRPNVRRANHLKCPSERVYRREADNTVIECSLTRIFNIGPLHQFEGFQPFVSTPQSNAYTTKSYSLLLLHHGDGSACQPKIERRE